MTLELIPHLHKATHQVGLFVGRHKTNLAVSQAEAHILAHLSPLTSCTIGELHASFGHKRSTLSSILNRLEERALIARKINPDDKRSFIIELTRKGKTAAKKVHASLRALEKAVAGAVSKAEVAGFLAVVAALCDAADDA